MAVDSTSKLFFTSVLAVILTKDEPLVSVSMSYLPSVTSPPLFVFIVE